MHLAIDARWDTVATLGIPVVPLVGNNEAMVSFEDFSSVKYSHGISPYSRSVFQDLNPDGMKGLWGVSKINMLLLGIGTGRALFERMIAGSCCGEATMYRTVVREKI